MLLQDEPSGADEPFDAPLQTQEEQHAEQQAAGTILRVDPIQLGGITVDIQSYLTREYEDISAAAAELPPVIEWVNSQLQLVIEQSMRLENATKEAEAKAWAYLQGNGWAERGYETKRSNYAMVMAIRLEPEVQLAKESLAVTTGWCNRLQNIMRSLQAKLDLVRSSEATRRSLIQNNFEQQ